MARATFLAREVVDGVVVIDGRSNLPISINFNAEFMVTISVPSSIVLFMTVKVLSVCTSWSISANVED